MTHLILLLIPCLISPLGTSSLDSAEVLYKEGRYESAKECALNAMNQAVSASDTTGIIKALCIQTNIAIGLGDDTSASEYYNRCLDILQYGEPMFMLSSSLYNMAMIYYQNGEYSRAAEYIRKSINTDSHRGSDAILALRYLLAAEISYKEGNYEEAAEFAVTGAEHTINNKNFNVAGRLKTIETMCREAQIKDRAEYADIEKGYREALELFSTKFNGYYYGAVNPYMPQTLYHLGLALNAQGKDGRESFVEAIRMSRISQKMRGINPLIELQSSQALAAIFREEGDSSAAARYESLSDSLSYVPYVLNMSANISLSQMEFIRREKDQQIEIQKEKKRGAIVAAIILSILLVTLLLMYRKLFQQKKSIEEKNGMLVKLSLQKDTLINMIKSSSMSPEVRSDLEIIAKDTVSIPEIKLTKRELQILKLCCKGLVCKEIASVLNISVRTVESHKYNIFQKTGVLSTNELITFALKSGLVK